MVSDPYSVLGIGKDATPEEIKKAYRTQAKKYHPDLHPDDPVAAAKMNEVNEAYDMLTNPQKYARQRTAGQGYSGQSAYRYGQGGYGGQGGYAGQNGYAGQGGYGGQNGYTGQRGNGYQGASQSGPGGWSTDYWGFDFSDLFGFGGYQSADTTPKPENGDSVELVRAIQFVNAGRYREAVDVLSKMVSGLRNARWYYVSAVAYEGCGDKERAMDMISKAIRLDPYNKVYTTLYRKYQVSERNEYTTVDFRTFNPFGILGKVILWFFIIQFILGFLRLLLFGFLL